MADHVALRSGALVVALALVTGCSGGGGGTSVLQPTPAPVSTGSLPSGSSTPNPSASAGAAADYNCPTSDSVSAVASRNRGDQARMRVAKATASSVHTGLVGVVYASQPSRMQTQLAVARETALGGALRNTISFSRTGRYARIVHVPVGSEAQAAAQLRTLPGVVAAGMTGLPRTRQTVSARYFTNDPYFDGFTATQIAASGGTGSPTYETGTYVESSTVPGQWDMHAIGLDYAFEYSQAGNGSTVTNANALGSSGVKIAMIDSGQDTTHPELSSKIAYQKCFITNAAGTAQSTSDFTTDQDGHGTDTAGIAAEATNNGLGFTAAGGNSTIYAYRVFPTPDDTCVPGYTGTADENCDASSADIASAISDAVAQGVNVISMSLGGGSCTNGQDPDPTEGAAINDAIAANIVVVASAGNDGTASVAAPGCDTGVIAVGASALDDGTANGSGATGGTAGTPTEYVASYSEYGSPAAAANSSSAWGIVAPGGDPSTADESTSAPTDDLHWIENIWTTTPLDANYAGSCGGDFGNPTGTADCRILIAGTSMSAPMVAGAAALIIAVNPGTYQSPTAMKQLLCSTATDIGAAHEGCGRLNVYKAMATALGDPSPPT